MIRVHYFNDRLARDVLDDLTSPFKENPDQVQADTATTIWKTGQYTAVAEIATDSFSHAYKMLQNGIVSASWTMEPPIGVTPLVSPIILHGRSYGWRSSMMGDLYERNGEFFVVARMGFNRIRALSAKEPA